MKRDTLEGFIKKARLVHGNKYDYSLVVYETSDKKVQIICPKHGVFIQKVNSHLNGCGCPACKSNRKITTKRLTTEKFIERSVKIHGNKYDYSKVIYKNLCTPVEIVCSKHGSFFQQPRVHLKGGKCPKCVFESHTKSKDQFIHEAETIHGKFYCYDKVVYEGCEKKVEIVCPIHGSFYQTPSIHLSGHGCPKCSFSSGEKKIEEFLIQHNICYKTQKWFHGCIDKRYLPFDFYLPLHNICIEYQGKQHYEPVTFGRSEEIAKAEFEERVKHDRIKRKYCLDNNIKLIEIKYTDNLESCLKNIFYLK